MRSKFSRRVSTGAAACILLAALGTLSANAACFESGVGCTNDHNIPASVLRPLSCDALWTVRNTIFDENGYCFRTARAQAVFSNAGCLYSSMDAMPLNAYESSNILTVRQVEREKGCR